MPTWKDALEFVIEVWEKRKEHPGKACLLSLVMGGALTYYGLLPLLQPDYDVAFAPDGGWTGFSAVGAPQDVEAHLLRDGKEIRTETIKGMNLSELANRKLTIDNRNHATLAVFLGSNQQGFVTLDGNTRDELIQGHIPIPTRIALTNSVSNIAATARAQSPAAQVTKPFENVSVQLLNWCMDGAWVEVRTGSDTSLSRCLTREEGLPVMDDGRQVIVKLASLDLESSKRASFLLIKY